MRTFMALYHLCLVVEEIVRRTCREDDLSMNDAAILCVFGNEQFIECSRIARNVGKARQNVQRSLERLRRLGLVDVERYEDSRRVAMWRITEKGHQRIFKVSDTFRDLEGLLRERISQFDSTVVNLEVMVDELDRDRQTGWSRLRLHTRLPKARQLNFIPDVG
jgi:DNA-binding MarR family transcriptional regulator